MAFKYNKRIKLGKGFGINVSKSGFSPSYRTKRGSFSSKSYSIKTGIPGLTYRKSFSKSKNNGCIVILSFLFLITTIIYSCSEDNNFSSCPTTANCGCSNKVKSDCEIDSCCQWIVGEGCKCN